MTEFASHYAEAKLAGWCSGKRNCYSCGQGWIQEGCGGCILPPAIFKHVFDEYSSIISNFFNNNEPYTLSTHNQKCTNKMHHIYLVKHSGLGSKNLNKICLKIVQKVLKWLLQYVNFEKFSREACPRTFYILIMFQNISA